MKNKKALFIINSLSNGGAERVSINMADELIKKGFYVDFIVLTALNKDKCSYEINEKINVISLNCNAKTRIGKIFELFLKIKKFNKIITNNELDNKYILITSHLPMANIITRFSIISKRAIYVIHNNLKAYVKIKNYISLKAFNWFFKNRKIVTVADGIRKEGISNYNMDDKYIKTIYNPIDIELISKKSKERIDNKYPYFIQVGRFGEAKRQDRMIDIFYKGQFYKKYKLLFCGTGELEEDIKKRVREYNLEDSVVFLGWQNNIYKWIKNAEILICTSDYEGFPMNLIEALACNTKVVASNCKFGPDEIMLDEYSKFLVKCDDIDDYIKKIKIALDKYPTKINPILEKCKASNIVDEYLEFAQMEIN